MYFSDFHQTPIIYDDEKIDPKGVPGGPEITADYDGLNLATVLVLVADDAGIACDYRFGRPWFTSREDSVAWVDPTGTTTLALRTGSSVERNWSSPVSAQALEQPLDVVLHNLCRPLGIVCDTDAIRSGDSKPRFPISINERGQPLWRVIAMVLYKAKCKCELESGTLVFKPQDETDIPVAGE